jgi:SEC-C motif-containing protein
VKLRRKPIGPCPCHSGRPYRACCGPLHDGQAAPDPEALMRSRFAAYALGKVGYLVDTTHPDGPHFRADTEAWRRDLRAFCKSTSFDGLEILDTGDDEVCFSAELRQGERDVSFVERSTFQTHEGRWKYLAGEPD